MEEEAVEAEAAEWAEAMVLIQEANVNLIDTVAAIDRKCLSSVMQAKRIGSQTDRFASSICFACVCQNLDESNCFSSLKGDEKRGGGGSHNWGTVKDELK